MQGSDGEPTRPRWSQSAGMVAKPRWGSARTCWWEGQDAPCAIRNCDQRIDCALNSMKRRGARRRLSGHLRVPPGEGRRERHQEGGRRETRARASPQGKAGEKRVKPTLWVATNREPCAGRPQATPPTQAGRLKARPGVGPVVGFCYK